MAVAALWCLLHWWEALTPAASLPQQALPARPAGASQEPILIEAVRQEKGVLQVIGGMPGIKAKPYRLRIALVPEDGGEALVLRTQMVCRPDLREEYGCDDHCGFAATISSKRLAGSVWRIAVLDGRAEETLWLTEARVLPEEGGAR